MTTDPKPIGPDPKAVRRALEAIDEAGAKVSEGEINTIEWADRIDRHLPCVLDAAQAWLARQDGETSE